MLLAIGAFALLQLAAFNLRGEERHPRPTRARPAVPAPSSSVIAAPRRDRGWHSARRLDAASLPSDLYDRVGGEPFFVALVAGFYARVATDPVLRPLYPEADLAPAQRRLTLFLPSTGAARVPTTPSAAIRACGCATPRSPSTGRSRRVARPDAGGARGRGRAADDVGRARRVLRRWPPRRCATAADRRPAASTPGGHRRAPGTLAERGGSTRGRRWRRHWRTARSQPPARRWSAARRSTAKRPTPATASSPPTTPRSRPISRPRSRRPHPDRSPVTGRRRDGRARPGRRPRLRQPVRPADRAPRARARRLLGAPARTTRPTRSSSAAAPAPIILSGGPNSVYDEARPSRTRPSGAAGSRSWASATARS